MADSKKSQTDSQQEEGQLYFVPEFERTVRAETAESAYNIAKQEAEKEQN